MKRGQIIKQVILDKCNERETYGYTNLHDSDVIDILNTLRSKGITLTSEEMVSLGFTEGGKTQDKDDLDMTGIEI